VHAECVEVEVVRRGAHLLEDVLQRDRLAVRRVRHHLVRRDAALLLDEAEQVLLVHRCGEVDVRVHLADVVKVAVRHLALLCRLALLVLHHVKVEARLEPLQPPPRERVHGRVGADPHQQREVGSVLGEGGRRLEGAVVGVATAERRLRVRAPDEHHAAVHLEVKALGVDRRRRRERVVAGRAVLGAGDEPVVGQPPVHPQLPLVALHRLPVLVPERDRLPELGAHARDLLVVQLALLLGHGLPHGVWRHQRPVVGQRERRRGLVPQRLFLRWLGRGTHRLRRLGRRGQRSARGLRTRGGCGVCLTRRGGRVNSRRSSRSADLERRAGPPPGPAGAPYGPRGAREA